MNLISNPPRTFWRLLAVPFIMLGFAFLPTASAINTARFAVVTGASSIPQGSTGNQIITVTNVGPDAATNTIVKYAPPTTSGITVNSVTASPGGTCLLTNAIYSCPSIGNVAFNGIITLTVNMTVNGSVPIGTSAGSSVITDSSEFNPGSGTGESLFSTWGATGVSGAAGDAFWFAFDGNYADTGYKSETGSTGTAPLTTDWPVAQANPRGTYSVKFDDPTYKQSDNPNDTAAVNSASHPLPYNAFGTANSTIQPPKNQNIVTTPPTVNLPQPGDLKSQNNRRVWEVRTGVYLNSPQSLYVCVSQPDDAMYVAIDPSTSGTIAAYSSTYNSGVVNSGGTVLSAGYHEVIYRIFNRNNQSNSFESGIGGFNALGMGTAVSTSSTTTAQCSSSNYNTFTKVGPASNITVATASADLAISKSNGVSSVTSGASTTYTIRVTNNGPSSVTGAIVKDPSATGLTQTMAACTAANTCTTAPTTGELQGTGMTLPTLASGAFYEFTVTATVTAANGSVANTATVAVPGSVTDPTPGNNSAGDMDTVTPRPTLTITKISTGGTGTFNFTSNNGFADSITTVTAGVGVAGTTKTLTAAGAATTVTETALAGFQITNVSCTGLGSGTVTPNYAAGTFTLNAAATIAGNAMACTVTNSAQTDLSITKTDNQTQYVPGQTSIYTIVATNGGPNSANGAVFKDPAISNLTISSVTCSSVTGGAVCPTSANTTTTLMQGTGILIPTMPTGSTVTFTVTGIVAASTTGNLTNTATITAPSGIIDPTTANNTASDTDTLIGSDVSVTKTGPAYANPAKSITYTLTAKNETATAAAGVVVIDTLPTGVTDVTADSSGTYDSATGKVTWNLGSLAANATRTLTVTVTTPSAALLVAGGTTSLTNKADISATVDTNAGNNTSSVITQMVLTEVIKRVRNVSDDERQNPVVARFGVTGGGQPSEILEYCLTFRNLGGVQLSNYVLTDIVPANINALTTIEVYTGQAIRLTRGGTGVAGSPDVTGGTVTYPTATDTDIATDQGSLTTTGGLTTLTIKLNTPLPIGKTGQACFRGSIK